MNNIIVLAELSDVQLRYTADSQKPIQEAIATFRSGYGDKIETHTIKAVKWGEEPLETGILEGRLRVEKNVGYQLTINDCVPSPVGAKPANWGIFAGRAGRDPEVKYFESGSIVAKFAIACSRNSKNDQEPDWINLEIWGKTAQVAADYVRKGSLIGVMGELKIERWQDKDGNPASKPVIKVERMELLGSRKENEQYQQQEQRQPAMAAAGTSTAKYSVDIDDDTIPF